MNITEFLLARIAEDEAVALRASGQIGQRWYGNGGELRTLAHGDPRATEPCWLQIAKMGSEYGPHGRPAEWETGWWPRVDAFAHMGRFDPARVLAECAAKRAIIGDPDYRGGVMYYHSMMALAAVYADHPDYQQEWAL